MQRARRTDHNRSEYEPPIVEDLQTEGEGATVTLAGGPAASGPFAALAEPTDNPPAADDR